MGSVILALAAVVAAGCLASIVNIVNEWRL